MNTGMDYAARMIEMIHDCDPRDRRNALWVVSPDVYYELGRAYPETDWPPPSAIKVGAAPTLETSARIYGVEIRVNYGAAPATVVLDVDDAVTRAVKRARARDPRGERVVVNLLQPERIEIGPFLAPAPEVTLRALVRKWMRKWMRKVRS